MVFYRFDFMGGFVHVGDIELQKLYKDGNIFQHLVEGHPGMKSKNTFDFTEYGIKRCEFNAIRYIIRFPQSKYDNKILKLIDNGRIREVSDILGGFSTIDTFLYKHSEKKSDFRRYVLENRDEFDFTTIYIEFDTDPKDIRDQILKNEYLGYTVYDFESISMNVRFIYMCKPKQKNDDL